VVHPGSRRFAPLPSVLSTRGSSTHPCRKDTTKPCAEALITDRVAVRMLDAGLMPLLSEKHGDAVRVAAVQSIADGGAPLAGFRN
jgi:hypothetical protein